MIISKGSLCLISRVLSLALAVALPISCSDDDDPGVTEPTEPTEPPSWRLIQQELPSALLSVQVVDNGDVYAVGSDVIDGRGPYVLRYDGVAWTRLSTGAAGDLWWVHEISADRILLCGANRLILSFQPSTGTFTKMEVPEGDEILYGIWGLERDDLWAVGGDGRCGVALHYNGTTWSERALPEAEGIECVPTLFKVWGTSGRDLRMVGALGATLAYDGSELTFDQTDTKRTLLTLHGSEDGEFSVAVGGAQSGEIRELIDDAWVDVTPDRTRQMLGVNVGRSGVAVAAGVGTTTMRRGADGWVTERNGMLAVNDLTFHAVWVDDNDNAWAVGGSLLVPPFDRGVIAYYGTFTPSSEVVNGR